MKIEVSKRLEMIADSVAPYKHIVDIGTDHCYVPIFLVLNKTIDDAIAIDINEGPIKEAAKNVESYHLENRIETRIGNGLHALSEVDLCDVIIIAGMGGKLIVDILNTNKVILNQNKRLILQPNVSESVVREWLGENHYEIVSEKILEEDSKIYEIIVADKTNRAVPLSDEELMFGPLLLPQKNKLFIKKWQEVLQYKKTVEQNIPIHHPNKNYFIHEIKLIESMLESGE